MSEEKQKNLGEELEKPSESGSFKDVDIFDINENLKGELERLSEEIVELLSVVEEGVLKDRVGNLADTAVELRGEINVMKEIIIQRITWPILPNISVLQTICLILPFSSISCDLLSINFEKAYG